MLTGLSRGKLHNPLDLVTEEDIQAAPEEKRDYLCGFNPAEPHRWNAQGEISNDLTLSRHTLIGPSKNRRYKRPLLFTIECRLTVRLPQFLVPDMPKKKGNERSQPQKSGLNQVSSAKSPRANTLQHFLLQKRASAQIALNGTRPDGSCGSCD
jgi:hypothetical protein